LVLRRFTNLFLVIATAAASLCGAPGVARAVSEPTRNSAPDASIMQIDEPRFLGNRLQRETVLTDTEGRQFRVAEMMGKPLILLLSYYGCDGTCPAMNAELAKVLEKVGRFKLGKGLPGADRILRHAGYAGHGKAVPRRRGGGAGGDAGRLAARRPARRGRAGIYGGRLDSASSGRMRQRRSCIRTCWCF
jgi:hypothetical protein